jgi:hypothetical protein
VLASDPELPQLAPTVSHEELVSAFNKLTNRFLERCLAAHLDTALSLESDDWAANCYMQRKVYLLGYLSVTFVFLVFLLGCYKWVSRLIISYSSVRTQ